MNVYFYFLFLVAKDVNIFFDELEGVNSPSKDDDSLLHHGNLTSTSDDASRLEVVGEVRTRCIINIIIIHAHYKKGINVI